MGILDSISFLHTFILMMVKGHFFWPAFNQEYGNPCIVINDENLVSILPHYLFGSCSFRNVYKAMWITSQGYLSHGEKSPVRKHTLYFVDAGSFYLGWLLALFNEKRWYMFINSPTQHMCSFVLGVCPLSSHNFTFSPILKVSSLLWSCTG